VFELQIQVLPVPGEPVLEAFEQVGTHADVGTAHEILCPPEEAAEDGALLGRVSEFCHRAILNSPDAMKYLQSRACFPPEAVAYFKIGYANRTIGYRVPSARARVPADDADLHARLVRRLKEVHAATHPGAKLGPASTSSAQARPNPKAAS
jgi:hypothetical protein